MSIPPDYLVDMLGIYEEMPARTPTPPPNPSIKQSNLSQSHFLRLPTEVRLQIYAFSLISSSSIIVWSAEMPRGHYPKPTHALNWNRAKMKSSTQDLALGLLRCNTTIGVESAAIFYHHNVFRFEGDHKYYPVITWLNKLNKNREYLTRLEITVVRPSTAWQMPDGSRHKMSGTETRGLARHHPLFAPPPSGQPYQEGEVDVIDPAFETIISLLAKHEDYVDRRKVTLVLDTGHNTIPGILLEDGHEDASLFSMDLPNLLDMWRRNYFQMPDEDENKQGAEACASLDLIWKAEISPMFFDRSKHLLRGIGWEVFDQRESEWIYSKLVHGPHTWTHEDIAIPTVRLLMRRIRFVAPIMAADPSPWTQWDRNPTEGQ
ncbi:MAG: hypothetical protein Q9169_007287 [Polycauliona sp. 2 TL-2023]